MSITNHHAAINRPVRYQCVISRAVSEFMVTEKRSQAQLGEMLGLTQPAISRRLAGNSAWTLRDIEFLVSHDIVPVTVLEVVEP